MSIDALGQMKASDWDAWAESGFFIALNAQSLLVGWGKPQRLESPGKARLALFAPDFYLEDPSPWFVFPNYAVTSTADLIKLSEDRVKSQAPWNWQEPDQEEFSKRFGSVMVAIEKGEISKAVPVVFATAQAKSVKEDFPRLVSALLRNFGKRTPYGFWFEDEGMLGASPEVLFHIRGNDSILETMALAGTRLTDFELKSSLINDPKEMYEHELVVRGIKEQLKSLGDLRITPTYIWDIGRICHLRTDIEVELRDLDFTADNFKRVLEVLHPTAAMGIAPVSKPFRYLKNFEGHVERGRFGAPFGVWDSSGRTRVLVAIRNLIWSGKLAQIGTGAGLVKQSVLDSEWREHGVKRQTVMELFEF
jgi:menaquinone-specific isochorismate synthase